MSTLIEPQVLLWTGPMFSGKTNEVLTWIKGMEKIFSSSSVFVVKHIIDKRYKGNKYLCSHNGRFHFPCYPISNSVQILDFVMSRKGVIGIAIDELQFFDDPELLGTLELLLKEGYVLRMVGVDYTFKMTVFGQMDRVSKWVADFGGEVVKLQAKCTLCGTLCEFTQRFYPDGRPASSRDGDILVGDANLYQPRCLECREHPYIPLDHPSYQGR